MLRRPPWHAHAAHWNLCVRELRRARQQKSKEQSSREWSFGVGSEESTALPTHERMAEAPDRSPDSEDEENLMEIRRV